MNSKNNTTRRRLASNKGFGLVEVLLVLFLIGGLAAVVFTNAGGTTPRANGNTDLRALASLQDNIDRFVLEYGSVPAPWFATSGLEEVLTNAEVDLMIKSLQGLYLATDTGTDAALAAHSASNPTLRSSELYTAYAPRLTAYVTASGAGVGGRKVVLLQYRGRATGYFINGDKTISTAKIAAGTAVVSPAFASASAHWTGRGKANWPW
jgi:prepilin-type N-terminal cleavage/methylation domain-containing protein